MHSCSPPTPLGPQPTLLQDMKPFCGRQLESVLQNSYSFSLLDSSDRPLDICAAFCGSDTEQQCTVNATVLPRLDALHQLHDYDSSLWALAAKGNGSGGGNAGGSGSGGNDDSREQQGNATAAGAPAAAPSADDSSGSGVNVGAVVAGAVVGSGESLVCGAECLMAGGRGAPEPVGMQQHMPGACRVATIGNGPARRA